MSSLFRRTLKYLPGQLVDPGENRLTEALAAVLERTPGLPTVVVREWCGVAVIAEGTTWRERVRTQCQTEGGGFVDLEIRLVPELADGGNHRGEGRAEPESSVLVWVEVKNGAGLHGAQLETYLRDIEREGASHTHVQLLVPRGFDEPYPKAVRCETWQQLAARLKRFRYGTASRNSVESWLVGELLAYLKEENLMDDDRLNAQHAFVASVLPATQSVFTALWDIVEGRVRTGWCTKSKSRRAGETCWVTYPIDPTGPVSVPGAWLEWGMKADNKRDDPRNSLVIYAGLNATTRAHPTLSGDHGDAVAAWSDLGFERIDDEYPRIWKFLYIDDLLPYPTLEEQAHEVAKWILVTFGQVTERLPAASAPIV